MCNNFFLSCEYCIWSFNHLFVFQLIKIIKYKYKLQTSHSRPQKSNRPIVPRLAKTCTHISGLHVLCPSQFGNIFHLLFGKMCQFFQLSRFIYDSIISSVTPFVILERKSHPFFFSLFQP